MLGGGIAGRAIPAAISGSEALLPAAVLAAIEHVPGASLALAALPIAKALLKIPGVRNAFPALGEAAGAGLGANMPVINPGNLPQIPTKGF
jgi:hypothetical protein